jgi:hypothetical protein
MQVVIPLLLLMMAKIRKRNRHKNEEYRNG